MRLTNLIFLLLLLVATVQCWWPWGGDKDEEASDLKAQEGKEEVDKKEEEEEGFREQLERDLAGVGQEVVFESEQPAESTKHREEDLVKEEKEEKVKATKVDSGENWTESELSEADAANVAALLETPELARKLDRKAFEEKLDEVAKIIQPLV